ncbi:MAG: metallophosphoesterase [Cyclobacteriaceae bacterium]|nr:metallophosphoesterase [Cyclobacteriaceae bacterium]MDX5467092.1 metallophosphoesterase [Cyclobacteriaceae bacterium]
MKSKAHFLILFFLCTSFSFSASAQTNFRIFPYLQVGKNNLIQIRWFSSSGLGSSILIKNSDGIVLFSSDVLGVEQANLYYTSPEKNQVISGLEGQNWIGAEKYFRYEYQFTGPFNQTLTYEVSLGGQKFISQFKTGPDPKNWEKIRFVALADSETEPFGRVNHRAYYPGNPLIRPFSTPALWKQKFGTTTEEGFEIPNYFLTEQKGFAENLKVIRERKPDFVVMPGDLVQGSGYMPAWDEFWRHTAGEFDQIFTKFPVVPALGNWETFGAYNGGYGFNERGTFNPILGRSRFHTFFEIPSEDPLQKHRQSYYRTDFGPVTILTLDSNNGTPEEKRSDYPADQKLKGKEYNGPGTDTQENYTLADYQAAGGTDLSGFGPGTAQYIWLETNLKSAQEEKRLVFVQFHHIPFASGEHGVPMNHELSTGQGGTPLRVLHPLFEQYGVIAVLSGHDELFERSFVDENSDGKGVLYYDVGLAGDGMRGVKRDWINNPLNPLNYNPYSKWTADLNSPEVWNTSGSVPILVDGGKHYGHLEVNLTRIKDGNKYFAQIDFDPVYIFPVMNQNYDLERIERRVYEDRVRVMVELGEETVVPVFKEKILVEIGADGKAETSLKNYLQNEPQPDWTAEYSLGPVYSCENTGLKEVQVKVTNAKGESWTKVVLVEIKDTSKPILEVKRPSLVFDKTKGVLEINPELFVASLSDNCGIKSLEINKSRFTCGDLDLPHEIIVTAIDFSGNTESKLVEVFLSSIESQKVSLSKTGQLFEGGTVGLVLGEELPFEVVEWTRNFVVIPEAKGKVYVTDKPGRYQALLRFSSGCTVLSQELEISLSEFPFPELKELIELNLGEEGKAELAISQVFTQWPFESAGLTFELSQQLFTCSDLGEKRIKLIIRNAEGQTWEREIVVLVRDKIKPVLIPKTIELELDVAIGIAEITPNQILELSKDNCTLKSLTISKSGFSCEDVGKEIAVAIRAEDQSGNVTEAIAIVKVKRKEAQIVQISGKKEICQGEKSVLELSSTASFEVVRWRRNGVEVPGQTSKTLETGEPGVYHAVIRYSGGCLSESQNFEVKVNPKPSGEIKVDGNKLSAPEGTFTYQWFRNGEKLEGKTTRVLEVDRMGEYSVELTSSGGCKAMLSAVTMTIAGLGNKWVKNPGVLKIYPNPASNSTKIQLSIDMFGGEEFELNLFNAEGKEVSSQISWLRIETDVLELYLNDLAKGTYLVWVFGPNQASFTGKLVIQ